MITIIGVGRMGKAIGTRLSGLGKTVIFGARDPEREDVIALAESCEGEATTASIEQACKQAEIIIMCTPYAAMEDIVPQMGAISRKTIIDVTNALSMSDDGLMRLCSKTSAGEEFQAAFPECHVIKALNTIGFHIIADPSGTSGPVSSLLAGNNAEAKQNVSNLVNELGFETSDVGPIRQSRYLEGMSALYLTPYLQGRMADAFEFYLRTGASPKESKGVRAAG